jgi:hypothetical protein
MLIFALGGLEWSATRSGHFILDIHFNVTQFMNKTFKFSHLN